MIQGRKARPQAQNLLAKESHAWGFASPLWLQFEAEFEAELFGRLRNKERPQCTSSASYDRLIRIEDKTCWIETSSIVMARMNAEEGEEE